MAASLQPEQNKKPGLLILYLPIFDWLPRYDRSWLSFDILAGLTLWGLVVPDASANCLKDQPVTACNVPPALQNYTITLNSGEEVSP